MLKPMQQEDQQSQSNLRFLSKYDNQNDENKNSIVISIENPFLIIVAILAILLFVVCCACVYSIKKAADNAKKDRVVTIIGNIEYFNNNPNLSNSKSNQVASTK